MKGIQSIIAVSSGKGGVGKSLVASTLALALKEEGCKVGLFDLDFTSPSTHIILGVGDMQPKECKGIIPPEAYGLQYMSIVYYSGQKATPLRGADFSNALIELLSITKWNTLDYLVLDMPPGIGDATLDLIRLIKKIEFIIVTTPSQLAFETVKKLVSLLKTLKIPIVGVVENMKMNSMNTIRLQVEKLNVSFLAQIAYDYSVEKAIGEVENLLNTTIAQKTREIAQRICANHH
jgi:ATP-binding protein involved in chromosome partitioning